MGRYAGRSCTTCEEKSERAPVSGRSAKPLPQLPSPLTAKSQPKRPKRPKADRDLWVFERQAFGLGYATVAGVDEAGRGPWAGPVVAGAAIMRPYFHCEGIDDSKLLTAEERDHYYDCILEGAEAWGVGIMEVDEIDRVGVARANRWAMGIALQQLGRQIDYLLIDGFLLPESRTPLGQLDLVAADGATLVFVEVKTRAGHGFGLPQESVDGRKIRKLRQLALYYLKMRPYRGPVRFDVVGLTVTNGRLTRVDHIKNAID